MHRVVWCGAVVLDTKSWCDASCVTRAVKSWTLDMCCSIYDISATAEASACCALKPDTHQQASLLVPVYCCLFSRHGQGHIGKPTYVKVSSVM